MATMQGVIGHKGKAAAVHEDSLELLIVSEYRTKNATM